MLLSAVHNHLRYINVPRKKSCYIPNSLKVYLILLYNLIIGNIVTFYNPNKLGFDGKIYDIEINIGIFTRPLVLDIIMATMHRLRRIWRIALNTLYFTPNRNNHLLLIMTIWNSASISISTIWMNAIQNQIVKLKSERCRLWIIVGSTKKGCQINLNKKGLANPIL